MIHRFALAVALFTLGALMPTYGSASPVAVMQSAAVAQALPPLFSTESAAQSHCLHDTVVWLNIPSGHLPLQGRALVWTDEARRLCLREGGDCGW